jgi:hypothetical protein
MVKLEVNFLIQIMSVFIVLVASSIPIYFALKIKTERQRILSSFLFVALIAYCIHSLLESFELVNYKVFTRLCFVISAFGLMATYSLYQFRTNHVLIGGIFGSAMIVVFGMWMVGELIEAIVIRPTEDGEYGVKSIDSISSIGMAGFGIFLIARFFWLRSFMSIEPKHVRS